MLILFVFVSLCIYIYNFIKKYFLVEELDLIERYGYNSWVLITGSSSGQGKQFALEFAKRGFNIILSGSNEILSVEKIINSKFKKVKTKTIIVDFSNAHQEKFFDVFNTTINDISGNISILVNNVGHRVAWNPYHEMPEKMINDSIIAGTIVQARLTQIAIRNFLKRPEKSAILNITVQCIVPSYFDNNGYITVPYLSVYEGANAFGFFHSNSIQEEYGDKIDILNITPGAVITENTQFLRGVLFNVECKPFVRNIFKLIGNFTGPTTAHWKHELGSILCNLSSNFKKTILTNVGKKISKNFMMNNNKIFTN